MATFSSIEATLTTFVNRWQAPPLYNHLLRCEILWRVVACCLLLSSVLVLTGCDTSQPTVEGIPTNNPRAQLVSTSVSARSILNNCIDRYQSLKSYCDEGFVRLRYKVDGKLTEDRAPMSVAWDSEGRIGLRVYAVTAGPTSNGRWHLKLGNTYPELGNQILSRAVPSRVDLGWLHVEPLISESLSAGLGGFPLQLDLILNPKPLSRLTTDEAKIELLGTSTIEGQAVSVVSIAQSTLVYKFWIDKSTNLVRRLELPKQLLPQDILSDTSVTEVELSVELANSKINEKIDWRKFTVEQMANDMLVTQFVSPPPQLLTQRLGKEVPAFRLLDAQGKVAFDSTPRADRKASVLIWLADHPACLAAAEQLGELAVQLKQAGVSEKEFELVPIWAESKPPAGLSFQTLKQQWKLPGTLAIDKNAAGRDIFHVQEAPTVAILDGSGKLQFMDVRLNPTLDRALAPIVARVIHGVDVAREIVFAAGTADVRFRSNLARLASSDAGEQQRSFSESYPPESIQLVKAASIDAPHRQVAIAQTNLQSIVTLSANGLLQAYDFELKLQDSQKLQITGQIGSRARICPSPDNRFVAIAVSESMIAIHDWKTKQSLQYPIPSSGKLNDFQWLRVGASKTSRLAVVTSAKQVLLLDPENKEQLSGASEQMPVAILPQHSGSDVDGLVVMQDRSLEQLKLSSEASTPAARPARYLLSGASEKRPPLLFSPSFGPWASNDSSKSKQCLANGLIAADEPALFVLDEQLRPMWSYRLPTAHSQQSLHQLAYAAAPATGATIWAILDATGTIHLLRGDVHWMDHFRLQNVPIGIAMQAVGDRLNLIVASSTSLETYRLE